MPSIFWGISIYSNVTVTMCIPAHVRWSFAFDTIFCIDKIWKRNSEINLILKETTTKLHASKHRPDCMYFISFHFILNIALLVNIVHMQWSCLCQFHGEFLQRVIILVSGIVAHISNSNIIFRKPHYYCIHCTLCSHEHIAAVEKHIYIYPISLCAPRLCSVQCALCTIVHSRC